MESAACTVLDGYLKATVYEHPVNGEKEWRGCQLGPKASCVPLVLYSDASTLSRVEVSVYRGHPRWQIYTGSVCYYRMSISQMLLCSGWEHSYHFSKSCKEVAVCLKKVHMWGEPCEFLLSKENKSVNCVHIVRPKGLQVCNCIWASHLLCLVYELKIGSNWGHGEPSPKDRLSLITSEVLMKKATGGKDQEGNDSHWNRVN